MQSLILKERRRSPRMPLVLTVLGQVEAHTIAMCSDNINLDGMFLFSREFIRPQSVFAARIWISNEEEPLQVWLTSCFTERTWTGYGIGVHISGISASDAALWESYYRCCLAEHGKQLHQLVTPERLAGNRHIVVVDGALNRLALQALKQQAGFAVSHVPSVEEALRLLHSEPVDAVICDLRRQGLDGLALCCHARGHRLSTRTVLLTDSTVPKDFLLGLYAGATRVVAKQCSHELLVSRILAVLQQPLPVNRKLAASTATLPSAVSLSSVSSVR